MAIHYAVQAEVVDITADTPKQQDAFMVDTNVWYWMTYPNAALFSQVDQSNYPRYFNDALENGSTIYNSGLTLPELAHIIEKTERDIYSQYVSKIETKEYRHNLHHERTRVVEIIKSAWLQVSSLAVPLSLTIDNITTSATLDRLQTDKVDGYDLFILESMKTHNVVQVITDDGDFTTVPGIQVFTANRNVIQAARSQGRLITRETL